MEDKLQFELGRVKYHFDRQHTISFGMSLVCGVIQIGFGVILAMKTEVPKFDQVPIFTVNLIRVFCGLIMAMICHTEFKCGLDKMKFALNEKHTI